ncbi:hypothetical protein Dalu01_01472 [Deinococcus aluminii]|uniref:PEGA domain-containing protein n=1 Tax=Deinococcus aluminii TaxID=1656885 RepID=A0ABP9XCJ4_9DEIO
MREFTVRPYTCPVKPIGPYVAARDLTGDRPAGTVRTLRATDRLTGIPVLLHVLPHAVPLPDLPADPALLPSSEGGIDGDTAYVVTELPPHALPASDPLLTARGGLAGLAALHEAGLTHGGVDAAQLWSVDGRVALAGAGLPWGGEATPARDLRDLLRALDTLGGVPPALRELPGGATARDLLARLDAPAPVREAPRRGAPPIVPAQERPEKEEPPPSPAAAPASPVPAPPPLEVTAVPPGPVPRASESEDAASVPAEEGPPSAPAGVEPGGDASPGEAAPVPSAVPRPVTGRVPARRVADQPVRITWDADGTRRVIKPGRETPPARPRSPGWLLPVLALLLLLLLIGAWWAWRSAAASAPVPVPAATTTQPCCDVRFTVRGVQGVPVRLSLVSAPSGVKVNPDQEVGRAPGVVRLPRPGTYTLRVAAEGYTPGTVTVKAPSAVPVQIALTP